MENNLNNTLVLERLLALGLELPEATSPGGSYQSVNIRGKIAYVAIQFPILNKAFLFKGKLGIQYNTQEGYNAMQLCALNVISQIYSKIGFENVLGMNHLDIYYQSSEYWDDSPLVADGASELFLNLMGEQGNHLRALIGAYHLPRNFCVGLSSSLTLK